MIKITTCQAENTFEITQRLAAYLEARLGMAVACVQDVPWQERYRRLAAGQITIGWICGLPYILQADRSEADIELLAAPVMRGERYGARPCYFSDVVVPADSPFQQFGDLRGASWAYNEHGSHSGYNITRYTLATMAADGRFFGRVVGAGSHMASLGLILRGEIDAAAIDSTVLAWALGTRPEIGGQIRVIAALGPSPIPPLIIHKSAPPQLAARIRALLCQMHTQTAGQAVLACGDLLRFTAVQDTDYNPIRAMHQKAQSISL